MTAQEILSKLKAFVSSERSMRGCDGYYHPDADEAYIARDHGRDEGKSDLLDDLEYTLKQIEKEISSEG